MNFFPDGYVVYAFRSAKAKTFSWTGAQTAIPVFVHLIEREVPCGWIPGADEASR